MKRSAVRAGLLAWPLLAASLAGTASLQAQTFDLDLVDGGKPAPQADVLLLVDGGKVPLGRTDSSGRLAIATNRLERGTPVDVYEIECDGETVIVIVPPEEIELLEEECERRRRENPNCACRRIGGFLWGDDVTIDVGRGQVVPRTPERMVGYGDGRLIQLGLGVGYSRWPHIDRACNLPGVVGCQLKESRAMYQALLDWYFWRRLGLSLELDYTPGLEVDHTSFQSGGGFPERSVTELNVLGLGLLLSARQAFGLQRQHAFFGSFGPMWVVNLGDVRTDYGNASIGILEESRHDPGLRLAARGGFDWGFGDGRWGSRFEIGGMTGEEHDIDASWFIGWKLLFRPGFQGL